MAKDKLICKYKASDELAKLQCNLKVGNVHVIVVKEVNLLEKVNRKEDAEDAKTVFAVPYRCHCQSERGNIFFCERNPKLSTCSQIWFGSTQDKQNY